MQSIFYFFLKIKIEKKQKAFIVKLVLSVMNKLKKSKKKRKAPENIVASPTSTEESDSKGQDKIVKI